MNNISSLEQNSKTGNIDASFLLLQHKLDMMARFMDIKPVNPKIKQKNSKRIRLFKFYITTL